MNIVQITPGAGGMYCGNCFRDNTLVAQLRQMGHHVLMVPLYLPMTLEEADQSAGTPVFFNGINVYLEQKSAFFRRAPHWLHDLLASPKLLKWAAGKAARTRAQDVGDLAVSMLRGEHGNQARELDELIAWLKTQPRPDVICLSNALLIGLARKLSGELDAPVICMLQGEDAFLDALPPNFRDAAWETLAERAADVALFIAPSHYFGELMAKRMGLTPDRVRVVYNGINLEGYSGEPNANIAPVLGYFARMCKEKGLDTLVEAFILLRHRENTRRVELRIGGGCGPGDEPFVNQLRDRLAKANVLDAVSFHPNLDRAAKLAFLRSLDIFSVPAGYGEAFGLYVIEALAAGLPVVQPRTASFPELVEATGGGVLCEPGDPKSLADAIESLLVDPVQARALGESGRLAVQDRFGAGTMAKAMADVFRDAARKLKAFVT